MSGHDDGKNIDLEAEFKRLDRSYSYMTWMAYAVIIVCVVGVGLLLKG